MALSYAEKKLKADTKQKAAKANKINTCFGCSESLCDICQMCHTPDCKYLNMAVKDYAAAMEYRYVDARTQKAKGFAALQFKGNLAVPQPYTLVLEESDIERSVAALIQRGLTSFFVRPCPIRPRHGFEESRKVSFETPEEAVEKVREIWRAAQAADDQHQAELILLPYIPAICNSIITPTRAAVGPKHDGATSGYDSISIPLAGTQFYEFSDSDDFLSSAAIGPTDDPYFEVVADGLMEPVFTQLRAGVKLSKNCGEDYVPAPMRVLEIIEAAGDLLEWERQVKEIKPGTVVVKPGGTLISHYGVHCLYNKVACFTTRTPQIGELLEPIGVTPEPNPEAVIRGLAHGALVGATITNVKNFKNGIGISPLLIMMMTTLHNSAAMSGDHGYWLGAATSVMMRAGMAASHGEARHKLQDLGNMRNYIYKLAFSDFMGARNTIGTAKWMFENLAWSSSYGGKAWAQCTEAVIQLDTTVKKLLDKPSQQAVSDMVTQLNVAVNQAHNGGWWLNKFIDQMWFNLAAKQSVRSLAIAVHTMYFLKHHSEKLGDKATELIEQWKAAPYINATEPGGKLQAQIVNPMLDQSTFSTEKKKAQFSPNAMKIEEKVIDTSMMTPAVLAVVKSKGWKKPNAYDENALLPHFMLCSKCGMEFPDLDPDLEYLDPVRAHKDDPNSACDGWLAKHVAGTIKWFEYAAANQVTGDGSDEEDFDEDSDENESSDDYYEPDCTCSECQKHYAAQNGAAENPNQGVQAPEGVIIPEGCMYSPQVESIPQVKSILPTAKYANMNGAAPQTDMSPGARVNFSNNFTVAHFQWTQPSILTKYFSADCKVAMTLEQQEKVGKGQEKPHISWSGSGIANYWVLQVEKLADKQFKLTQPELGLVFTASLSGELMEPPKFTQIEVKSGQESTEEVKLEEAPEIPF